MAEEGNSKQRNEPGGMKSVSLTPMSLRNEPARDIKAASVVSRNISMGSVRSDVSEAKSVHEDRFSFSQLHETRPDLRREEERYFALNPITVAPSDMRELRARRIAARDLGWVIPGHRIRIKE